MCVNKKIVPHSLPPITAEKTNGYAGKYIWSKYDDLQSFCTTINAK